MKITYIRQHRSREKGNMCFVYAVSGTPEQIAKYKASKGEYYRETKEEEFGFPKGTALFFSNRFVGKHGKLHETAKKEWVIDTTEADQLISMTAQCGGNVELAKELLAKQNIQE